MAKDRKFLQHIHSSVADKQPTPSTLEIGELAVNNSADKEFISLKNSNDKVVRISSDSQLVTWMEKKEVFPYSGTVENIHLDTNRSNIELKFNQVAASNTKFYETVNNAKDIDNNPVNPSLDGGITNGAGIAIDTSAFALIGGNPTFSSLTTTSNAVIGGTLNVSNSGMTTNLNWIYGDAAHSQSGTTNFKDDKTIVIPNSLSGLQEWSSACLTIDNDICLSGKITVTDGVFSTSDERKKDNIEYIDNDSKLKVRNIPLKSFSFKNDDTKRKVYGVIAQDVEKAGLNELVYTDNEGNKSVDYTSLLILRISYLEKVIGHLSGKVLELEKLINEKNS